MEPAKRTRQFKSQPFDERGSELVAYDSHRGDLGQLINLEIGAKRERGGDEGNTATGTPVNQRPGSSRLKTGDKSWRQRMQKKAAELYAC